MLKIFISFVVASVAVIAGLVLTGAELSQYIAVLISLLALRVESDNGVKLYTPLQQVDFEKYISGKRKLHAENIKGFFNAFALGGNGTH